MTKRTTGGVTDIAGPICYLANINLCTIADVVNFGSTDKFVVLDFKSVIIVPAFKKMMTKMPKERATVCGALVVPLLCFLI